MDNFGIKKAIQEIANGNVIKMESSDFKTHLFYQSKSGFGKPIIHTIRKSIGRPVDLHLTYDEFKEKFGENYFYIYNN
jgi:hypothetical protein